ncbi:MAG: NAD(P)-binding protein [Actinomycetia bacterium]|nr:NAD(P)-binding protein [Actinomycetes bacterium]MCP4961166.1 NAD(P)-binding protein [Actinomycetes bacterium]
MTESDVDVIIIGSGVAGMTAAALLARDCGQRVVVLERSPFIGGRCLSYVGHGDKIYADGIEMGPAEFKRSLGLAHCYLSKCTPDIETIFDEGLLDGRTFEAGGHGLFWGNSSRTDHLLQHFDKHVTMPLNQGLGFIDWHGMDADGTVRPTVSHQVEKGTAYPWMTPDGFASTRHYLGEMGRLSADDLTELAHTSLQDWLETADLHPEAYDYIKVLSASQTGDAEPRMTAAPDFLGYMAVARQLGMSLVSGSVATVDTPGTIAIPMALEEVITSHGGRVLRDTPVTEVLIDNGITSGVRYRSGDEEHTLEAKHVICTLPPKIAFRVLPRDAFPGDWVDFVENQHRGIGLLTGWAGTKRSIIADLGIEPDSFVYMPAITTEEEGFIGKVDMVMCEFTAWGEGAAKRAPDDKSEYLFSTALTPEEMRDPERVGLVIERCEAWARANFPTWDEDVEFIIWTPSPEALGTNRPLGTDRVPHQSAHAHGLWFAGDQYGEKNWGCGVDAAVLSAIVCVDNMMGTGFEENILPELHRGIVMQ